MERMLDAVAEELGIDRAEVRRRNLIGAAEMPYVTPLKTRDGGTMTYDSGDYPACQASALELVDHGAFVQRQRLARDEGRFVGLGLANYVEGSGRGPFESATVKIGPSGRVVVASGVTAQGQGIATVLAQIAADVLGVSMEQVRVISGDTAATTMGVGAFASRQAAVGGSAVHQAAVAVRDKALAAAATLLECSAQELELVDGVVRMRGEPARSLRLGEIAKALTALPGYAIPAGSTPGLEASVNFSPPAMTYCNGTHVVEVEVDAETGRVDVLRYVVVHDSGRLINPKIVEGQVVGGLVHALGNALMEEMVYDGEGQPLTTTYGDYLLPTACGLPRIEIHHLNSPTPHNPLGAKGAGESGTLPVTAAIASAVEDALSPFGVRIASVPIRPQDIIAAVGAGR
jgi:carbon-monoxide dehydrogenase large subunit